STTTSLLPLHDALPICTAYVACQGEAGLRPEKRQPPKRDAVALLSNRFISLIKSAENVTIGLLQQWHRSRLVARHILRIRTRIRSEEHTSELQSRENIV